MNRIKEFRKKKQDHRKTTCWSHWNVPVKHFNDLNRPAKSWSRPCQTHRRIL